MRNDDGVGMKVDLAAIGGGFAGLTAAVRAAELGLEAVVIERGEGEAYMCNSRVCTGVLHTALANAGDPPDIVYERVMKNTGGTARPDLARTFAENGARTAAWMEAHGATLETVARRNYGLPSLAPVRRMGAGLDWEGNGPDLFLRGLANRLEAAGGTILRGTEARALVMEDGACRGVAVRDANGGRTIEAGAVVIADGGFQADRARLARHIAGRPERIRQRNTETGRGDGLRMAEEAGAATVGLDKFYGHVLSRDVMTDPELWPYPQVDVICASGIVVGADAKRFTDEGLGGVYITNEIARLDDPLSATAIFDSTVWEQAKEADLVPPNPLLVEAGGTLHAAGSIGELALRAGLDTGGLETTVAAFNAAVKGARTDTLTPARTTETYTPVPIETPPFHAIPLAAGITVTMGGIAVDGAARVLRPDDTPIPGLYAAGSTVGGVEGGPNAAYIGGLIKAFLLGLVAAETAAREIGASD